VIQTRNVPLKLAREKLITVITPTQEVGLGVLLIQLLKQLVMIVMITIAMVMLIPLIRIAPFVPLIPTVHALQTNA
jgi:hypothetical protein